MMMIDSLLIGCDWMTYFSLIVILMLVVVIIIKKKGYNKYI